MRNSYSTHQKKRYDPPFFRGFPLASRVEGGERKLLFKTQRVVELSCDLNVR